MKHRQLLGIVVAAAILIAIFIPFQKAEAYTVNLTLPNASTSAVPTSAIGSTFKATIDVSAGELISVSQIELILDNGNSGVKQAIFDANGHRISGSPTLARGNLDVTIPSPSTTGYGYGYGSVSNGATFSPQYSYSFSYSNALISGNTGGYSNAVPGANPVSGFVGPGTITIEGKLNTAQMSVGTHTLDVLIHTGTGVNPDKLVAPQLTFTTVGNSSIQSVTVGAGNNVSIQPNIPGVGQISLIISNVQTGGTAIVEPFTSSALQSLLPGIFVVTGTNTGIINLGNSDATSIGTVFEIDLSGLTLGPSATIDVTLPFDPSLLPSGFNEADLKFYHWNGSIWEDSTRSVDANANTVTGRVSSLSPVVLGFTTSSPTTTITTQAGGGGSPIDLTPGISQLPAKIQLQSTSVLDENGLNVSQATSGQQLGIRTSFRNLQQTEQSYAMIVQVIDRDGFTSDIGWVTGKLASGESTQTSKSWTAGDAGSYTIKIFAWDSVSGAPMPLSEVTTKNFVVT